MASDGATSPTSFSSDEEIFREVSEINRAMASLMDHRHKKKFRRVVICEIHSDSGTTEQQKKPSSLSLLQLHLNTCRDDPHEFTEKFMNKCSSSQAKATDVFDLVISHASKMSSTRERNCVRNLTSRLINDNSLFRKRLESLSLSVRGSSNPRDALAFIVCAPSDHVRGVLRDMIETRSPPLGEEHVLKILDMCAQRYQDGAWPDRNMLLSIVKMATVKFTDRSLRLRAMNIETTLSSAPPIPTRRASHA